MEKEKDKFKEFIFENNKEAFENVRNMSLDEIKYEIEVSKRILKLKDKEDEEKGLAKNHEGATLRRRMLRGKILMYENYMKMIQNES